jgi:ribonuclease R
MLRSMQKAVYQPKNIGHFGLAFKHYAHFTSPIRRYPDLIVHRLLRQLKNGRYPVALDKKLGSILTHVGKHCSETERNAEAAEREAVRYKQTIFMKQRLGEEYKGVISGVLSFGFFVRLNTMGAEGMVRLSSVNDDYYSYDEAHHRLVGRRTGRIFRMGDPVTVSVAGVDVAKNEINLALVEAESEYYQPRKKKKRRRR